MAASAGRDFALSISLDGGSTFTPLAGMKARSFDINGTNVDVTTADSAGRWQEMLASAGVMSLSIDGQGVWQRDAMGKQVIQNMVAQTLMRLRFASSSSGIQIDGTFLVDSFKLSANYNDANTFDAKFVSSGQITITLS